MRIPVWSIPAMLVPRAVVSSGASAGRAALFLMLVALAPGCDAQPFECKSNEACVHAGVQGMCEPAGFCSFPDASCNGSGRRYGPSAAEPGACVASSSAPCVQQLALGAQHSCALKDDGSVWCWGSNARGQLGEATSPSALLPMRIAGVPAAKKLSAGESHTCALAESGEVWCWGANEAGQLGRPPGSPASSAPAKVEQLASMVDVSAGGKHTCAAGANGDVYCWGSNTHGQLGDGDKTDLPQPEKVSKLAAVVGVEGGGEHTCARQGDGRILCWGSNEHGQCGLGKSAAESLLPAEATEVGSGGAAQLTAGQEQTCVLSADRVSCWGALGSDTIDGGLAVLRGVSSSHLCALLDRNGGELWCRGNNDHGQLGSGESAGNVVEPVRVRLPTVTKVGATGAGHTCVVTTDGALFCWGENDEGQLGSGRSSADVRDPTAVAICP